MFDQDMWLYYMCLKQRFFSSVFFRFSLMLTVYKKNHMFLVVFVWYAWLLSEYKNNSLLLLLKFTLQILDLSLEAAIVVL